MPYFVSKDLTEVKEATPIKGGRLNDFRLVPDTEFTQSAFMNVDCIGLYSPDLIPEYALIFTKEDLTEDFNPVYSTLYYSGHKVEELDETLEESLLIDLESINESFFESCEGLHGRSIRKIFNGSLESGEFDNFLEKWRLKRENLSVGRIKTYEGSNYCIQIEPKKINAQLVFFFAPADLFKIWGKNHQKLILESQLYQYRSLRFLDKPTRLLYSDGELIQLSFEVRDTMYRLPPVDRSLKGQSKAFALSGSKLNLETREISERLGLDSPDQVKENMSLLFEAMPEESLKYNAQDIFLTSELDNTQRIFLNKMRNFFGLNNEEIADTTGKNVSVMIKDLILKHYCVETDKDGIRLINNLFKIGKGQNLQKISSNHFGIQPFLTVGGLLFSRMARYPKIEGNLGDLDLKSCYASAMAQMNVYLGEPKCLTFRYKKYKPTLRDALKLIQNESAPNDGWFVRVSGKFEKAFNTLIMSDLRFTNKKDYLKEKRNLSLSKKSIGHFNAEKTSKTSATSTILLKEIKFGLINWNLLKVLELLPEEWLEEYLNLSVDAIVYYPGEMIVDTIEEYKELISELSEEPEIEELNQDKKALVTQTQHYKNNVVLRFPISDYWSQLREKRNKLKKSKDPVQSVYKLAQNSGYGAFACMYLAINNLVTSNMITAMARSNAWLMVYALNGFSPITDGTCFNWNTVPYKLTLKEILESDPSYIYSYNDTIESGIEANSTGQEWIDKNFKKHLSDFFQIPLNHPLITLFDYELKDESFLTKEGAKALESWQSTLDFKPTEPEKSEYLKKLNEKTGEKYYITTTSYNTYINTNGANYVKALNNSTVLIDDYEYDLVDQTSQIKARSYSSTRDYGLLPWYIKSVTEKYESPYIYEENNVIKFGQGNDLVIRYIDELQCEIAHPMGFSFRQVKLMKLISRSQFLFLSESQLRNFETNEKTLSDLSKVRVGNKRPLLDKTYFENLTNEAVKPYGGEVRENVDYFSYSKSHPVGCGFELLTFNRSHNGSIASVRRAIQEKILDGCKDFNANFQVQRSIKYAEKFKNILASVIIKRKNYDEDLKQVLLESAKEPTVLTVSPENIYSLAQLWGYSDED